MNLDRPRIIEKRPDPADDPDKVDGKVIIKHGIKALLMMMVMMIISACVYF